jgi:hypothetical protein
MHLQYALNAAAASEVLPGAHVQTAERDWLVSMAHYDEAEVITKWQKREARGLKHVMELRAQKSQMSLPISLSEFVVDIIEVSICSLILQCGCG